MFFELLAFVLGMVSLYFTLLDIKSGIAFLGFGAKFKFEEKPSGYIITIGFKLLLALILLYYSLS